MNITKFIEWFITQFINIATEMMSILDNITIAPNVTLLEFIIAIVIISAFAMIIITVPTLNVVERRLNIKDRQARRQARQKKGN